MSIHQFTQKKATKETKGTYGVRMDLNSLIVKTDKQNELIEHQNELVYKLIKTVDLLSSEVLRGNR